MRNFTPQRIRKAFTLLEMLAVIIILGVISTIVVMRVFSIIDTAKINTCYENQANIDHTIDRYQIENGS